jgi:hypothetical protein
MTLTRGIIGSGLTSRFSRPPADPYPENWVSWSDFDFDFDFEDLHSSTDAFAS